MAYNKTIWVNGVTPVDADNMNNIENGISSLDTNKLDKSDVVNTKTESEGNGKALNAVQANPNITGTLANQLEELTNGRGFLNIKSVSTTWSSVMKNGKYAGYNLIDAPEQGTFVVDVTSYDASNIVQIGTNTFTKNTWRNIYSGSAWTGWQQLATATKLAINSFGGGWTNYTGFNSYLTKIGNTVFCNMVVGGGTSAQGTVLYNIPVGFRPTANQLRVVDSRSSASQTDYSRGQIYIQSNGDIVLQTGILSNMLVIDTKWEV